MKKTRHSSQKLLKKIRENVRKSEMPCSAPVPHARHQVRTHCWHPLGVADAQVVEVAWTTHLSKEGPPVVFPGEDPLISAALWRAVIKKGSAEGLYGALVLVPDEIVQLSIWISKCEPQLHGKEELTTKQSAKQKPKSYFVLQRRRKEALLVLHIAVTQK